MESQAVFYYKQDYNCSQCILKAAEQKYKIPINKDILDMFSGISTGMGIGSMCSVLVAGIAVFGLLFDDATTKSMRIKLFDRFMDNRGSMCCPALISERGSEGGCESIVSEIAQLVDDIISEELQQQS